MYSGYTFLNEPTKEILSRMPPKTKGALVSTSRHPLYGKCNVTLKSTKGKGVITTLVLISQVGDKIDFEFLGTVLRKMFNQIILP